MRNWKSRYLFAAAAALSFGLAIGYARAEIVEIADAVVVHRLPGDEGKVLQAVYVSARPDKSGRELVVDAVLKTSPAVEINSIGEASFPAARFARVPAKGFTHVIFEMADSAGAPMERLGHIPARKLPRLPRSPSGILLVDATHDLKQ